MFTHLETHSYYTLLGSTIPINELVARAAAEGMAHLALTDTNALYGVLAFNRACHAAGVQAIILVEEEPRLYSIYLPHFYTAITSQTGRLGDWCPKGTRRQTARFITASCVVRHARYE